VEAGFRILSNLFTFTYKTSNPFEQDLYNLFLEGMQKPDIAVKLAAI